MDFSDKKLHYRTSTKPQKWKETLYRYFLNTFGFIFRALLKRRFYNIEVSGRENLKDGPYLLLMNHSSPLDPLLITFFGGVPLHFLISESYMQQGLGSFIGSITGQITKRKLDMDTSSIKLMKEWVKVGGNVALFPEGAFSWDGKPGPILPGLDQLIRMLDIPVVCVNLQNGDKIKPAWANFYRKTSIKINIHPPKKFEPHNEIVQYIKNKIFEGSYEASADGTDLASGLSRFLRYCPECQSDNTLKENGNFIKCESCQAEWEVKPDNTLFGKEKSSINDLIDLVKKRDLENKYHSLNKVNIFDIKSKDWVFLERGKLKITKDKVQVGNKEVPVSEILNHSMDWGDIVLLRTKKGRYAIQACKDSRLFITQTLDKVVHVNV